MPSPLGGSGLGGGAPPVPTLPQQHPGPATTILVTPYEREVLQVSHFPSKVRPIALLYIARAAIDSMLALDFMEQEPYS